MLVDLRGDQLPILGLAATPSTGLFDWLASRADRRESLERLSVPTTIGLHVVPPGVPVRCEPDRIDQLVAVLASFDCPVIIDCGVRRSVDDVEVLDSGAGLDRLVEALCDSSRSVLVSSSCYLAVRRAVHLLTDDRHRVPDRSPEPHDVEGEHRGDDLDGSGYGGLPTVSGVRADGLVVIADPGRALDAADIASVTQLELLASSERDPAVARSVDAGVFLHRPPRGLLRALGGLV